MSISKAQAAALADGFLDDLGSDRDQFVPKETYTEIILFAGELIEAAQQNLISSNSNASGNLSASLTALDPEVNGTVFSVDVVMAFYGQFINRGVKGTKSGAGQYSFKNDYPSESMVKSILEYIKRAQISTQSVKKYSAAGSNEAKNKSISEQSRAYAMARSIKQHGIQATGFMDKAIDTTQRKISDRLGAALKVDIINSLNL